MRPKYPALIALVLAVGGCATAPDPVQGDDSDSQLQRLAVLLDASDAEKAAALPQLIEWSESPDATRRNAAWQTLDMLHFSDARLGWQVAASNAGLCKRTVASVQSRWPEADDVIRDGLVQALAGGRCAEIEDWIWALVEGTDTGMSRETGLYRWVDVRRGAETTTRLLALARNPGAPEGRVGPVCELMAARAAAGALDEAQRREALALVHDSRVTPGVRTVLGEAVLGGRPPLGEDAVLAVVVGSEAPSELRKSLVSALIGAASGGAISAAAIAVLAKVTTDTASPPDLRVHAAQALVKLAKADAVAPLSQVAADVSAPRGLRATMISELVEVGGEEVAGVMAKVVLQGDSHPDTRSLAMAALEGAWSGDAEAACVKVCELGPTSELCKGGIERLTGHGSARLADAQAFGFVLRISAAGDPKGVAAIRAEMSAPIVDALPEAVRAYALTLAGVAAADAAAARRFGDDEDGKKIDPAICTMREGWERVNALKAQGAKDEAASVQRSMYRADHLLRDTVVAGKVKAAKRAMKAGLQEAGAAAVLLSDPSWVEKLDKMVGGKVGMLAPCVLIPELERARRNAKRGG